MSPKSFVSSFILCAVLIIPVSARAADDKAPAAVPAPPAMLAVRAPTRGPVLPALYASLAALNLYDGLSTSAALNRGAVDKNPMMASVAGNPVSLWIVKGASTAASIYFAERLWKQHHRAQAVVVMLAANGMMAVVAVHNQSVVSQLK